MWDNINQQATLQELSKRICAVNEDEQWEQQGPQTVSVALDKGQEGG